VSFFKRLTTLVVAAAFLAATGTPRAASFTVFGPRTLTRTTGAPNVFDFTFSVPNPSLPYTLQIDNDGIASAIVSVNGTQIVGPSDFNPNIKIIQRNIGVRSSNALHVELRSKPGSHITIRVLGRDEAPPTITASVTPAANSAGWHRTNVQVTFTCGDAGSGTAICPPSKVVTTEGQGQVISGTATDAAGNTATASVTLNIDKTTPIITAKTEQIPSADGWIGGAAIITFECNDENSGIATCPSPITVLNDGVADFPHLRAVDRAGNVGETSASVKVDSTAPTITATLDPAPNTIGWNNFNVTVAFECRDATSGIAFCSPAVTVIDDVMRLPITGTARDRAGHSVSTTVHVSVDKTAPSIVPAFSPRPNPHGWNNGDVVVSFECGDTGSGVESCPDPVTVTGEGRDLPASRTIRDRAGNTAMAPVSLNIDRTPTTIAPDVLPRPNDAGWNKSDVTNTFSCDDRASGVDVCASAARESRHGARRGVRRQQRPEEA